MNEAQPNTPREDTTEIMEEIRRTEDNFTEYFRRMDDDRFVEQGVSIFRTASEIIPTTGDSDSNGALETILKSLISAEAPKPTMGMKTTIAWRMYTAELVRRTKEAEEETSFRIQYEDFS